MVSGAQVQEVSGNEFIARMKNCQPDMLGIKIDQGPVHKEYTFSFVSRKGIRVQAVLSRDIYHHLPKQFQTFLTQTAATDDYVGDLWLSDPLDYLVHEDEEVTDPDITDPKV